MRNGIIGFASLLASAVLAIAATARAGDTVTYYYNDAQGSPVVAADAQGNVIERTDYAPYGATLNRPIHDGPGYTGHEEDSATGLTYMQQRFYDSQSGQFISTDPVLPDGGTGASFNRYAYASDNPYRYTDPDGRCSDAGGGCDQMVQSYAATPEAQTSTSGLSSPQAQIAIGILSVESGARGAVEAVKALASVAREAVSQTGKEIVANLAKGAIRDDVKGAVRQIVKDGGEKQFNQDAAAAMKGAKINSSTEVEGKGVVQTAEHSDGTRVGARTFSGSDGKGPPTIQVNDPSTKVVTKVRYPDDH